MLELERIRVRHESYMHAANKHSITVHLHKLYWTWVNTNHLRQYTAYNMSNSFKLEDYLINCTIININTHRRISTASRLVALLGEACAAGPETQCRTRTGGVSALVLARERAHAV